ncbi:MAG: DUF262 domain-containing protein [Victivallaceae bacterium]|nr:DUF262 domain-containing protein [Victivallaceae bacterium]
MNSELTSLWAYLEKHRIVIPLIQRDYAQGREGKSALRKRFWGSLKQALTGNQPLLLDFVYGDSCGDDLHPIDGQQRLTTLWLLHWYIAMRAGCLDDAKSRLKKFSYETRTSSRDFCEKLIDWSPSDHNPLKKQIENQTWFRSEWKQDPTIDAMLRMLSGEDGEDNDCIEKVFGNQESGYKSWWSSITGNCFQFYSLDMGTMENVDDLYIKMNARGEQLTDFENFKADLIDYIQKQAEQPNSPDKDYWKNLNDAQKGIAIKMDTDWTDIFWQNQKNGRIDELYFAFINRFWRSALIVASLMSEDNLSETVLFKLPDRYEDFCIYKNPKQGINLDIKNILISLRKTLDNIKSYVARCPLLKDIDTSPVWDNEQKVYLIPRYNIGNVSFSQGKVGEKEERLIHFALCKFFENNQLNDTTKTQFDDWMRVAWNIAENSSTTSEIGIMRLLNELGNHAGNILNFLVGGEISHGAAENQVNEEREKARKIRIPIYGDRWKELIETAEAHPLLHGSIRAVLWDNKTSADEWEKIIQDFTEFLPKNADNDQFVQCGKDLLQYGDYSIQEGSNRVFGTNNRESWEKLLHAPNEQTESRVRPILQRYLKDEESQSFTNKEWQYYFINYSDFFLKDCARYRWNGKWSLIKKMTGDNLHAYSCNPFLAAIVGDNSKLQNYWVCSSDTGMIYLAEGSITLSIDSLKFIVESEKQITDFYQDYLVNSEKPCRWEIPFAEDIVLQGKNILTQLQQNRYPSQTSRSADI